MATTDAGDTKLVDSLSELQGDVFAGRLDPGDITIVRTVEVAPAGTDVDTAVFSDVQSNYTITENADGTTTVAHTGGNGLDGTDTLRGIERIVFAAGPVATVPDAPTAGTATAGNGSAAVQFTAPFNDGGSPITEYRVQVRRGTTVVRTVTGISPTARSHVVTRLTNGTAYNFRVRAVNAVGVGLLSAASNTVTPTGTTTAPSAPVIGTATAGAAGGAITATATWQPPTSTGGSPITGYRVFALQMSSTGTVVQTQQSAVQPASARSLQMTPPAAGNYRFQVVAINAVGTSPRSARSNLVAGR